MDRIFLAFCFRPEDRDLVGAIESIIESHGVRAVSGEYLGGEQLTPAIMERIAHADALVAVMTAREIRPNGRYTTHPWVRDELNHARSIKKPGMAFVDRTVELDGAFQEHERIEYDSANPIPAFVKLSHTIGNWTRTDQQLKVRILPESLARRVSRNPDASRCEYRFSRNGRSEQWMQAPVLREIGGTFAYLNGAAPDALVEVRFRLPDGNWCSSATPQWLHVKLEKE